VSLPGSTWSFRIAVERWISAVEEAEIAGVVIRHSERGAMELFDVVASNAHDAYHDREDVARIVRER
jgi:hypothetical protein